MQNSLSKGRRLSLPHIFISMRKIYKASIVIICTVFFAASFFAASACMAQELHRFEKEEAAFPALEKDGGSLFTFEKEGAGQIPPQSPLFQRGEAANAQLSLTLRDGAVMVMENNLDITVERSKPQAASAQVRSASGVYNAEVYGEVKRADSTTQLSARSSAAAGGLKSSKEKTYSLSTGLKGKIALGTEYTLEFTDKSSADTFNGFKTQYTSFSGITITQPVLRNFGSDANDQLLKIARKDAEISMQRFRQTAIDVLSDYGIAYWELIRGREVYRVRSSNLELSESLQALVAKKLTAGAASQLDLTRSEAAVAARRAALLTARQSLKEKERALKLLITKDVYAIKDIEIVPVQSVTISPVAADLDESIRAATQLRSDYLEAKAQITKSGYKVRYAENQTYPKIDIESSYGYSGLGGTLRESVNGMDSNPQWMVGVVFSYPLGNDTAQGSLSAARIESAQNLIKLKKIEQGIVLEMDGAIKELKDSDERASNAKVSVELASRTLTAEEKKYSAGLSTLYDVLRVQDEFAQAQLENLAAVVDYNEALIKYNKSRGTLLDDWGVVITDLTEAE